MKTSFLLPFCLAIIAYHVAPVCAGDPWATMGVTCDLETTLVQIRNKEGCSKSQVRVKYCRGTCRSGSLFKVEYPYFQLACNCCKKLRTVMRPVLLACPGGSHRVKWIQYAAKCGCQRCT